MFAFSRTDTPVVVVDPAVDDGAFTPGDTSAWGAVFVATYRTARTNDVPLAGRVRMGVDLATRVMGSAPVFDGPVLFLVTLSTEYDGISLYADQSLDADAAVLE